MKNKRIIAGVLSASMMIGCLTFSSGRALAAKAASAGKEEVVYVMTDSSGKVNNINIVNIFVKGAVTDYGNYSSVKMLNTTDKISLNGDKVNFSTDEDRVYYQGTVNNLEIPWNIDLVYTLDGKEIKPYDLAGKSGKLKIKLKITENKKVKSTYYDDYALQVIFTLPTEKCKQIAAAGATLANVGADKQITYTVLPGKGLETVITSDVNDFEMKAVSINGIKLNLNVDFDDTVIMDKVNTIMNASKKINEGASTLAEGTGKLQEAGNKLKNGTDNINKAVKSLNNGVDALSNGIIETNQGLNKINSNSHSLKKGSGEIKRGIDMLLNKVSGENGISYAAYKGVMSKNGLSIDEIKSENDTAISTLSEQIMTLQNSLSRIKALSKGGASPEDKLRISQLEAQIESLSNIVKLLKGNNAAISGTEVYLNTAKRELSSGIKTLLKNYTALDTGINKYTAGVNKITANYDKLVTGASKLVSGSKNILNGTERIKSGSIDLYNGITKLSNGSTKLNTGTIEFYENTNNMDKEVEESIDEVKTSITGGDGKVVSFASPKNKNVKSVQFVIKTAAIEKQEKTVISRKIETKPSFWQKLINLFI